jgi:hypothetical protein
MLRDGKSLDFITKSDYYVFALDLASRTLDRKPETTHVQFAFVDTPGHLAVEDGIHPLFVSRIHRTATREA